MRDLRCRWRLAGVRHGLGSVLGSVLGVGLGVGVGPGMRSVAQRGELGERATQRGQAAGLGMIGGDGGVGALAEGAANKAGLSPLGSDLDEGPHAVGVHPLDHRDVPHRSGDLLAQQPHDGFAVRRVVVAGHVGEDRDARNVERNVPQMLGQRLASGSHDLGVEGVTHRERPGVDALSGEALRGGFDGDAAASDDRLGGAVLIGAHGVSRERLQHPAADLGRRRDGQHSAVVAVGGAHAGHRRASLSDRAQRGRKVHDPGRDAGAVLAEAVARDDVGLVAQRAKQRVKRSIRRQDRGLGDLGPGQRLEGPTLAVRVVRSQLGVHVAGERAVEDRGHHLVGERQGLGDDREG